MEYSVMICEGFAIHNVRNDPIHNYFHNPIPSFPTFRTSQ